MTGLGLMTGLSGDIRSRKGVAHWHFNGDRRRGECAESAMLHMLHPGCFGLYCFFVLFFSQEQIEES